VTLSVYFSGAGGSIYTFKETLIPITIASKMLIRAAAHRKRVTEASSPQSSRSKLLLKFSFILQT
jgi:hypothetical protein